jgi:hypothetical protein
VSGIQGAKAKLSLPPQLNKAQNPIIPRRLTPQSIIILPECSLRSVACSQLRGIRQTLFSKGIFLLHLLKPVRRIFYGNIPTGL